VHQGEPFSQPIVDKHFGGRNMMRRLFGRPAVTAFIASSIVVALVGAPLVSYAAPSTAAIRAKQAQANAADAKLQDLGAQLELKQTDLQSVTEALDGTRVDIAANEARLVAAEAKLAQSQDILASRADAMYRDDSSDFLTVLVGTASFDDFVTRIDLLNRITTSDADLIAEVKANRDAVAQAQTSLVNRESEEVALRAQAQAGAAEVQTAIDKQQTYRDSLTAEIKKLVKAEEDRLAKVAAELAKRAAEAASHASPRPSDAGSLGSSHPEAVTVAKGYLGVPYLWGGTTPKGFDCSGLVQYCYAKIGISIPRTSRAQFKIGQFIPAARTDLLEPGDLVFFAYNADPTQIHHVGMYAGGGAFIEAPCTGQRVRYASLSSRGDYVGAVRP
jgi:cell wall-associated NlpC family hydrolase